MLYTQNYYESTILNLKNNNISLNPHNSPFYRLQESGPERLNGLQKITKQLVRPCWEKVE